VVPIFADQQPLTLTRSEGPHTGSKPLPVNIRSVVAGTEPLFRCRSHMMSRRFSCGNMAETCSTCAAVKRRPLLRPLLDAPAPADDDVHHRYVKNITAVTKRREGIEIVACSSTALDMAVMAELWLRKGSYQVL
jgi:hypothetical protein